MITLKLLEIRDRGTFIPAFAFEPKLDTTHEQEHYLLRRSGFAIEPDAIFLGKLGDGECHCDPYLWKNPHTMTTAHLWIRNHWNEIESGDVIDVEFILGESKSKKISERIQ